MLASPIVRRSRIRFEERLCLGSRSNFESLLDPSCSGSRRKSERAIAAKERSITRVLPIMAAVLASFLTVGLALPVLPLHVHQSLGLGTFVVGLVTGSQFGASVGSRVWSGRYADRRGGKHTVIVGLLAASAAGLLYLLSLWFTAAPIMSVTILLVGRAVLGVAESLIITGAVNWGLALVEACDSGRVIAWIGMAMFAALALGAPIGTGVHSYGGFPAVAVVTTAVPWIPLFLVAALPSPGLHAGAYPAVSSVVRNVWMAGLGPALSSFGLCAILTFGSLLFADRGWSPVWTSFTSFAAGLILARAIFGHLPDRFGGARVALTCVFIETTGLATIWFASGPVLATAGAALTGIGFSLVYPSFGVEAIRVVTSQSRGLAMGVYTTFSDLALGLGGPALGLIARHAGLQSVFGVSSLAVFCAAIIALSFMQASNSTLLGRI